jgi:hypothetical protein
MQIAMSRKRVYGAGFLLILMIVLVALSGEGAWFTNRCPRRLIQGLPMTVCGIVLWVQQRMQESRLLPRTGRQELFEVLRVLAVSRSQ